MTLYELIIKTHAYVDAAELAVQAKRPGSACIELRRLYDLLGGELDGINDGPCESSDNAQT